MNNDIQSMFESIKESLNDKNINNESFRNFLKTEAGKTYLVRFIPNIKEPKATFHHYSHHGFTSFATGQYIDATCPRTFGERCPICETRFKLYKTKTEEDRKIAYAIRSHNKHLVNVYIINDPSNTENEGTVKILRFGKRIYDKILAATEGDDVDEFGARIYDLTENGCNFKIKVETASEKDRKFTNYNNSRFTAPGAIPNMTPEKIQEIYKNIFDLTKTVEIKTESELNNIIKTHILCNNAKINSTDFPPNESEEEPAENNEPIENVKTEPEGKEKITEKKTNASDNTKIKNLLDGLESL